MEEFRLNKNFKTKITYLHISSSFARFCPPKKCIWSGNSFQDFFCITLFTRKIKYFYGGISIKTYILNHKSSLFFFFFFAYLKKNQDFAVPKKCILASSIFRILFFFFFLIIHPPPPPLPKMHFEKNSFRHCFLHMLGMCV